MFILAFFLELFSWEPTYWFWERKCSVWSTHVHLFISAGMRMCPRSEVTRMPAIGYVPPLLSDSWTRQAPPPFPRPPRSARPPAHASTLTHLVNTSARSLTNTYSETLGGYMWNSCWDDVLDMFLILLQAGLVLPWWSRARSFLCACTFSSCSKSKSALSVLLWTLNARVPIVLFVDLQPRVDSPGSPTTASQIHLANLRSTNGQGVHDGPYDPCGEARLRNSSVSLEEKVRTMSGSGSFREGLEEGRTSSKSPKIKHHVFTKEQIDLHCSIRLIAKW